MSIEESKEILIFPYINTEKIIKMDDFEIHPLDKFNLKEELNDNEISILYQFTDSFRKSLFNEGENPEKAGGIGILKYKGSILRTNENSCNISDKIKIIFLLLKLHISIDFFNQWMSVIDIKSFDFFQFNLSNNITKKFGNMGECQTVHSTVPENIRGIKNITVLPLNISLNRFPVTFNIIPNAYEGLGVDQTCIDLTYLYKGIKMNEGYYQKIVNLSSINYGLEHQNDIFFYYALIPSIIEIINPPKKSKKYEGVCFGMKLDGLIKNNEYLETKYSLKKNYESSD